MKKKVKFYLKKAEALNFYDNPKKFILRIEIATKEVYDYQEMHEIFDYIKENGIEINCDSKKNKTCGDCKYYNLKIGCMNDKSRARNKNLRTKNSKGCYWGKWN